MKRSGLNVKFYEVFGDEKKQLQYFLPKTLRTEFTSRTIQEEKELGPPATLICTRTQSIVPLTWGKHIGGILTRSQGYDHLQKIARAYKGKLVCGYLDEYCARAVAEHVVMVMSALMRGLKRQMRNLQSFRREDMTGCEMLGKNLLVIGVGNLGREIVNVAHALRMNVKGVDVVRRLKSVHYVSLEQGMRWANIVVCALPLTEKTRGLLNYRVFKKSKQGVLFINVSRGEISPLGDLRRLMKESVVRALSLDVYESEAMLADSLRRKNKNKSKFVRDILELSARDNVLLTPHNAFNTHEALIEKCRQTAEEIKRFFKNGTFRRTVG